METRLMKNEWLLYVVLAGLSWGTYVPLIFYGGQELGGRPGSRFMAILCVGIAYFVIAVVFPMYMFLSRQAQWPELTTTGLVFSGLAGVAGAAGALCVIFASKSAVASGVAGARLYIAPLIFGLAPVINTVVSTLWHPESGNPFHFRLELPGWKLWAGILLVGVGAALVLYSKEEAEAEAGKKEAARPGPAAVAAAPAPPAGDSPSSLAP